MLRAKNIRPDVAAGHSLGEYSALVCAGALDFGEAVKLVRFRGECMERAMPGGGGGMAAVLGLADEIIAGVLARYAGHVEIANYNCPGQTVISGTNEALEKAGVELKAAGAKRVVPLAVSGPFHSSLMQTAAEEYKQRLDNARIGDPKIPVIANVTADYAPNAAVIKDLLYRQVFSPVRWTQSVRKMSADGVSVFTEVGPGNVLTNLVKKIIPAN
jgi:[acyl-carrier-protein] S-malonyltransferase